MELVYFQINNDFSEMAQNLLLKDRWVKKDLGQKQRN